MAGRRLRGAAEDAQTLSSSNEDFGGLSLLTRISRVSTVTLGHNNRGEAAARRVDARRGQLTFGAGGPMSAQLVEQRTGGEECEATRAEQ